MTLPRYRLQLLDYICEWLPWGGYYICTSPELGPEIEEYLLSRDRGDLTVRLVEDLGGGQMLDYGGITVEQRRDGV